MADKTYRLDFAMSNGSTKSVQFVAPQGEKGDKGDTGATGSNGAPGRSAYAYAKDGGYTGTEEQFAAKLAEEMPNVLPNPNKIVFVGAASGEYDGSEEVTIDIPSVGVDTETVLSDNLLDKSLMTKGGVWYYGSSGIQLAGNADSYSYYGFIPLRGAGTYRTKFQQSVHSSTGTRIALVNDNDVWVAYATGTCGEVVEDKNWVDFEFTVTPDHIAAGVTKVAFDVYSLFYDKTMIVKDREYPSEFIPYGYIEVATDSGKKQDNVLCGKTAVFLGDSICAGTTVGTDSPYYGYGWGGIIGENNHMTWTNYGKNGGTITHRGADGTCISKIADTAIAEHPSADYVIFEGGCNDADQMRESGLGEISADYAAFDTTTFSGALEALILKLVTAYPRAKIGYIIPQKMYTGYTDYTAKNHIHRKYFDRAVEICKKWGIPVVDVWNGSMLNPKLSTASVYYSDGIQHLTETGYLAITPMIESWMRNMYTTGAPAVSGGSGGSGGVTSWNDLPDRPFGESENAVLLPETEFVGGLMEGALVAMGSVVEFVEGETYTVNWNGVDYETVCFMGASPIDGTNMLILGNPAAVGGENNNLPFTLGGDTTGLAAIPLDGSTSATVSIKGYGVVPVPVQYVPYALPYWIRVTGNGTDDDPYVCDASVRKMEDAFNSGRQICLMICQKNGDFSISYTYVLAGRHYMGYDGDYQYGAVYVFNHSSGSLAAFSLVPNADGTYEVRE